MIITFINIIEDLGISRVAWGCQYDGVPEKWEGGGGGMGGALAVLYFRSDFRTATATHYFCIYFIKVYE